MKKTNIEDKYLDKIDNAFDISRWIVEQKNYLEDISKPFDKEFISVPEEKEVTLNFPIRSELFGINYEGNEDEETLESLKDDLTEIAARFFNNPDQFRKLINNQPSLIFNDSVIQYTILKLQRETKNKDSGMNIYKTGESAQQARKILQDAGLGLFVPKSIGKTNLPEGMLYEWKGNPRSLVTLVSIVRQELEVEFSKYKKSRKSRAEIFTDIYKKIYKSEVPQEIEKLIDRREDKKMEIAIGFIAYEHHTPIDSTIKFWYQEIPKDLKKLAHIPK